MFVLMLFQSQAHGAPASQASLGMFNSQASLTCRSHLFPLSISAKSDTVVLGFALCPRLFSSSAQAPIFRQFRQRHLCYLARVSPTDFAHIIPQHHQAIIQRIQSARSYLGVLDYGQSSNSSSICPLRCGQKGPLPWAFCHSPTAPTDEVPLT